MVVVVVVVECIFVMLITVSLRLQPHSSAPHCGHSDHGDTNTRGDTVRSRLAGGQAIVLIQQRFL